MSHYRYPGLSPFQLADASLFYGRERESRALFAQVSVEKMVVLFSRSGIGKSSLLNAGLVPLLEKTKLLPLNIRLNDEQLPLEQQFLEQLEKDELREAVQLDPALRRAGAPIWEQLKAARFRKNGAEALPLFIFDQFEEVFTLHSPARRQRFLAELADLANGQAPEGYLERLRARIEQGEQLDVPALEASPQVKLIFSIRADLLHLLNALSPLIPDILRSRFELMPLRREQAEEAITLPALLRDPVLPFLSRPFGYDETALTALLDYFTKDGTEDVESFQLQTVCRAIELQVIERRQRIVAPELFEGRTGLNRITRDFYSAEIGKLPAGQQAAARELLEAQLISDTGRRRSVAEDELLARPGADQALLDALVAARLLRKEPRLRTFYYEISHDTLVEPMLEKYRERRQEEAARAEAARLENERLEAIRLRAEAERKQQEAEAQAAEERQRAEEAERRKNEAEKQKKIAEQAQKEAEQGRKRARAFSYLAGVVAALAIGLGVFAFFKQEQQQAALAEIARRTLRDAQKQVQVLDYEGALATMQSAAALQAAQQAVSDALLEMVFYYAETGRLDRARGVLDTAARLAGRDLSLLLPQQTPRLSDFRAALKTLSPVRLDSLDARYFPVMLPVPGGTFTVGSPENEPDRGNDETQHSVTLSAFRMAKTETTWWQYHLFCAATGREEPEKPGWGSNGDNPVVNVSWYDAVDYANWLSRRAGSDEVMVKTDSVNNDYALQPQRKGYRLPTEAEWEYAARGNVSYTLYAGSNDLDSVAWHGGNSGSRTHAVAGKKANAFGLYDMSGNVYEWCWDRYGDYDPTKNIHPTGADNGIYRVLRGGGWGNDSQYCRTAYRNLDEPVHRYHHIGFRLALQ